MLPLTALKNTLFVVLLSLMACGRSQPGISAPQKSFPVVVGANRTRAYFPLLEGREFALVANQTSVIFTPDGQWVHLADSLLRAGLGLKKVFAPEHGFRGRVDAGDKVKDGTDPRTGLPVLSLYGANRKPRPEQLEGLDLMVFDIQDVGVRFYTYIATLQLVMEACAAAGIPVLVLDRPNPNGHYVDGPVMESEHRSFLGMTEIPLVYGMTIGEYARMINEEGWLEGGQKADLEVIPLEGYSRHQSYELPIPPSPNLPNAQAVRLYPSLGLFEGTHVNAGRGTTQQFQCFGAPFLSDKHFDYSYIPEPMPGATHPKHEGMHCHGRDLTRVVPPDSVDLKWLVEAFAHRDPEAPFFNTSGFTRHAGTQRLQEQIEAGWDARRIRASWQEPVDAFKKIRKKYLIYD
ncbi:MAG: exo-beta-N-acetylmuramidase NamZ family protein [Robiginitalea sp.]